ncbi:hypothetical protein V6N13_031819 [Hibiscus sabdariffa]
MFTNRLRQFMSYANGSPHPRFHGFSRISCPSRVPHDSLEVFEFRHLISFEPTVPTLQPSALPPTPPLTAAQAWPLSPSTLTQPTQQHHSSGTKIVQRKQMKQQSNLVVNNITSILFGGPSNFGHDIQS